MDKYEHVRQIIEDSSVTFSKAFGELEENKRNAVFSIYAYCRIADDAVDVDGDIDNVDELEKKVKDTFKGAVPDDPVFEALYETIMRYPSDEKPYLELLEAMRDDYHNTPIKTEDDLEEYCYKAAGTVGLMLIPVLASQSYKENSGKLKDVAIELGKAMQLTNILRDVKEDLGQGRVYFPDEAIEKQGIKIKTLRTGTVTDEYRALVEHYIKKAKEKYQVFYDNADLFDKDAVLPTYIAAKFYEGILDEIRKAGHTNVSRRHFVSSIRKFFIKRRAKRALKKRGILE